MKKIIIFIIAIICITIMCNTASHKYCYIDKYVYVYRFKEANKIILVDRHGSYFNMYVDSTQYEYFRQNKKSMFLVRKWDNGKIKLLNIVK